MLSRNDVLQKVNFYKTRKAIYNTDVVNRRNLLLFGTTAIRGGVEQCTSVYIAQRRVFALQKRHHSDRMSVLTKIIK